MDVWEWPCFPQCPWEKVSHSRLYGEKKICVHLGYIVMNEYPNYCFQCEWMSLVIRKGVYYWHWGKQSKAVVYTMCTHTTSELTSPAKCCLKHACCLLKQHLLKGLWMVWGFFTSFVYSSAIPITCGTLSELSWSLVPLPTPFACKAKGLSALALQSQSDLDQSWPHLCAFLRRRIYLDRIAIQPIHLR